MGKSYTENLKISCQTKNRIMYKVQININADDDYKSPCNIASCLIPIIDGPLFVALSSFEI